MAFCGKCGTRLPDSAKFCTSCGQASGGGSAVQVITRPQVQVNDISKMDRQALLATLTEADRVLTNYEACRDMAEEYKERALDVQFERVGAIRGFHTRSKEEKAEIERRDKELAKLYPKEAKRIHNLPIVGFLGMVVGVIVFILGFVFNSTAIWILSAIAFFGPLLFLPSIVTKWEEIRKSYAKWVTDNSAEVLVQAKQVDIALSACERSLALNAVPPAYRYTYAMEQMARFVQNLLADSWKECAVLYEDHMHKLRMEAHAEETKELAELSAFYAKQAKSSAGAAALFSGLNFFFG